MGRRYTHRTHIRDPIEIAQSNRPFSTPSRIVFPFERVSEQFLTSDANQAWINGKIRLEEIEDVLRSLKKARHFNYNRNLCCKFMAIPLPMVVLIIVMVSVLSSRDASKYVFLIPIAFILTFFAMVTLMLCAAFSSRSGLRKREKEFNKILDGHNKRFMGRGVNFVSGPVGAWVEMRIMNPNFTNVNMPPQVGFSQPTQGFGNFGHQGPIIQGGGMNYAPAPDYAKRENGFNYPGESKF